MKFQLIEIMHPKYLVVLLFLVSVIGYGQEYHPLLSNSGWCCEKCYGMGCVYDEYIRTGPELINDRQYYKINKYFLQEDSLSRKVWYLNDGEDEVIYDFSLDLDDTFQIELYDTIIGNYLVTEIDTISTLAGNRKRWFLNLTDSLTTSQGTLDRNLIWIEGIGSTYGPIYPMTIPLLSEYGVSGICLEGVYSADRTQIYQGYCTYITGYWPDECKFIKSGIEYINPEPTVVFFNEVGELVISSANLMSQIRIYDLSGRQLQSYKNLLAERNITISNQLPVGIYFCELYTDTNLRQCIKAIKCF